MKKTFVLILVLVVVVSSKAQQERSAKMGQTTIEELQMTSYEKDPTAPAVVLYEEGNHYYSDSKKKEFTRDTYLRIKILNTDGFSYGTQKFQVDTERAVITKIEGITYNLNDAGIIEETSFKQNDLLINQLDEETAEYIINLPNIKIGSVFELKFSYVTTSKGIGDWTFQYNIPVEKSVYSTMIPKTTGHIVNLIGLRPLTKKIKEETTKCFPSKKNSEKCTYSSYIMESIPAFKKEPFMPSSSLLISKLDFRFTYYVERGFFPVGMITKWRQFDSIARRSYFDQEMTKESFFKSIIPDSIYNNGTKLEIAKNIYSFVQNHYTWNGYIGGDLRKNIRKHYRSQEASVNLIATTLYNALKAADIECYYTVASSSSRGPIDKNTPTFSDFDFTVVKIVVDGKTYFLDATSKSLEFGYVQPFLISKQGRVLDYTTIGIDPDQGYEIFKGGYFEWMKPPQDASKIITSEWDFSLEKGFHGRLNVKYSGYNAFERRHYLSGKNSTNEQEKIAQNLIYNDLIKYDVKHTEDTEKSLVEDFTIETAKDELEELSEKTSFNFSHILMHLFDENPFEQDERLHPIDFIYPRNLKHRYTFTIPEGYDVQNLPKSAKFLFPENGGSYLYQIQKKENKLRIFINLKIIKTFYDVEQYEELKKLFTDMYRLEKTVFKLIKK